MSRFAIALMPCQARTALRSLSLLAIGIAGCKGTAEDAAPSASASAAAVPSLVVEQVVPAPPDVAVAPADAEKTPSGLVTKVIEPGKGGDHPEAGDVVTIEYVGWHRDGTMFDSSAGRPMNLGMGMLVPGWAEGVRLMVAGEKRRMWIPAALGYGGTGKLAGDLVMDTELLSIRRRAPSATAGSASAVEPAPDTPAPDDVAAPPKGATTTKSGLAYRVLEPSSGAHPTVTGAVLVDYTGWTTDGKMFDRSTAATRATPMRIDSVIAGWREGLQLMSVGEKARFWIPAKLSYGDNPPHRGVPSGMLVFDVQLLGID